MQMADSSSSPTTSRSSMELTPGSNLKCDQSPTFTTKHKARPLPPLSIKPQLHPKPDHCYHNGSPSKAGISPSLRRPGSPSSPSYNNSRYPNSVPIYIPQTGSPLLISQQVSPWEDNQANTPLPTADVSAGKPRDYEPIGQTKRTFADIIANSNISLPLTVTLRESMYGICESFTTYRHESLDIHFVKETLFANTLTSNGEKLQVPLYAPYTFNCDYSSHSLCDIDYKVSKLMKLGYLPKVGIVKNELKRNNKKLKSSEFTDGEVLLFKSRTKSSTIECFSLLHKETKKIHKSSDLTLTTNPSQLTFDFTELLFFDFPLQVKIHPSPSRLQTTFRPTSTIVSLNKKETLIVSFSRSVVHENSENFELFEFFPDTDFTFQLTCNLPQVKENLVKKSRIIYENFNPIHVKKVLYTVDESSYIQGKIYETMMNPNPGVGDERWKSVVRLCQPKCFYQTPLSADESAHLNQHKDGSFNRRHLSHQDRFSCSLTVPAPFMTPPTTTKKHSPCDDSWSNGQLLSRPQSFSCDPLLDDDRDDNTTSEFISSANENDKAVTRLDDLSCDQVLLLLESLGLSQHKEIFAKEKISGDLLKELNEEILEEELGIALKLHRIKLLRVIEGRVSIDSILT